MRRTLIALVPALLLAAVCYGDSFVFLDLGETVSLTLNGNLVTGNGGRISNFTQTGETISFNLETGCSFCIFNGFTNMLEADKTVSDRFVGLQNLSSTLFFVQFGSDPDLPAIPADSTDLTTIPVQGLTNPLFENGTTQLVATYLSPVSTNDQFFIASDVRESSVPEPGAFVLFGTCLIAVFRRLRAA
jgi:hypothetical protein